MATFRFATHRIEGRTVVLFLHGGEAPDDPTWTAAMDETAELLKTVPAKDFAFLVITDGGAPTTAQRRQLIVATNQQRLNLAVISTSPIVRGALTAISWINPNIKPFAPAKWHEAVAYCGLPTSTSAPLLEEMKKLQVLLGVSVKCLSDIQL